jgi:quinol monooxygenase YgiN
MKKLLLLFVVGICTLSACSPAANQENTSCVDQKESMVYLMNLQRKIKPEFVSAFRDSFEKCRVETLKEPGCVNYVMYQSYSDSTEFFITETWVNKEAHTLHGETPHLKVHIEDIRGMSDPDFKANNVRVYICPHVNE